MQTSSDKTNSEKATAQDLAGALGWIAHGKHSGTLKLRRHPEDELPAIEVAFLDGDLFLSADYPRPEAPDTGGADPAARRHRVRQLAEELDGYHPGNFRFRQVDPEQGGWQGPWPTVLLLMELAVLARAEAARPVEAGSTEGGKTDAEEPSSQTPAHENGEDSGDAAPERVSAPTGGDDAEAFEDHGFEDDLVHLPAHDAHPAAMAIWRDQFQLTGDPFTLTPDPAFLYHSDGHAEALAGLKLGIWERRGLMVMIGEVGTGKTTLIYSLLSNLDPDIETAYLSNTLLSFEEILATALEDFGVACLSRERIDLIEALNGFLRRCALEGKTAVLVIDEAQNLSDEVFEGLRLLLNFETYKNKLLQIVLVGQPELAIRLRSPGLRQVRDRIAVRCHLNPLSRREAMGYIEHRLEMVGGTSGLFTRPALGLLVRKSKGIPRRINVLCHNAMLFAYGRDRLRVDRGLASQAVRDIEGRGLRHD